MKSYQRLICARGPLQECWVWYRRIARALQFGQNFESWLIGSIEDRFTFVVSRLANGWIRSGRRGHCGWTDENHQAGLRLRRGGSLLPRLWPHCDRTPEEEDHLVHSVSSHQGEAKSRLHGQCCLFLFQNTHCCSFLGRAPDNGVAFLWVILASLSLWLSLQTDPRSHVDKHHSFQWSVLNKTCCSMRAYGFSTFRLIRGLALHSHWRLTWKRLRSVAMKFNGGFH